jgi:uncharacterized membrane protein
MTTEAIAPEAEPSSTDTSIAWIAYVLQATGALGFVLGPLAAVVISYTRRNAADAGYIGSHHRWLIRTFWWTVLWYLVCLAVILGGAWPILAEIVGEAIRTHGEASEFSFGFAWEALFATVGAAMAGGLGIVVVWIWNIYRILRGAFLLGDRSPAP